MKTTININGKTVEIELTADQVANIKKQSAHFTDIKSFDDACKFLGDNDEDVQNYVLVEDLISAPSHLTAYLKLCIICKALNGGEHLDYKDTSVYKYFPWFNSAGSVSGFSYVSYDCDDVSSVVSARLCLKSSEIAKYAGKQFLSIYARHLAPEA